MGTSATNGWYHNGGGTRLAVYGPQQQQQQIAHTPMKSVQFVDEDSLEPESLECKPCSRTFTTKRALVRHFRETRRHRTESDNVGRLPTCSICGVKCARPYDLRRHWDAKHSGSHSNSFHDTPGIQSTGTSRPQSQLSFRSGRTFAQPLRGESEDERFEFTVENDTASLGHSIPLNIEIRNDTQLEAGSSHGQFATAEAIVDELTNQLQHALSQHEYDIAGSLLRAGASHHHINSDGQTMLHRLAESNDAIGLALLLQYSANVKVSDVFGRQPIHIALEHEYCNIIKLLIVHGAECGTNSNGDTALHIAAKQRHFDLARYLLEHGFNINATNNSGDTALHLALEHADPSFAQALIAWGADVHQADGWSRTTLFLAVQAGHTLVMQDLALAGVSANACDKWGNLPLSIAIQNDDWCMVEDLEACGAQRGFLDQQDKIKIASMTIPGISTMATGFGW
jgi:hypothetical protein